MIAIQEHVAPFKREEFKTVEGFENYLISSFGNCLKKNWTIIVFDRNHQRWFY